MVWSEGRWGELGAKFARQADYGFPARVLSMIQAAFWKRVVTVWVFTKVEIQSSRVSHVLRFPI